MGIFSCVLPLMLSVISLDSVVGRKLTAMADFDAYNVYVGDPVALTVDFIGEADFAALHPPLLSEKVDRSVWKIDDKSAKTGTYRNARRLTYRVRPLKEGLLEFPPLEFSYRSADTGDSIKISTRPVPLRAKRGAQAVLSDGDGTGRSMPRPDGLFVDLSQSVWNSQQGMTDDVRFAWERACGICKAEAFRGFDFPEARLNEAACEILDGNWARALSIYSALEWRIGQTLSIERGITAALALKTANPEAELPMWRRVMRPVLRYTWKGRLAVLLGALALILLLCAVLKRVMRAIVSFGVAIMLCESAYAIDPFEEMERMHEELSRRMEAMSMPMRGGLGGASMSINGMQMKRPDIKLSVVADKPVLRVGETFNLIVNLDSPRECTLSGIRLDASEKTALNMAGKSENMPDAESDATNRVVRRISIPLRYDAPFKGPVIFTAAGMCESAVRRGNFSSSFSTSFSCASPPIDIEVKPLDGVDVPDDFNGCVGESFVFKQHVSAGKVETNDVVAITAVVQSDKGHIPDDAFACVIARNRGTVAFKKFFIANGAEKTDDLSFSYYDTARQKFCRAVASGVPLEYAPPKSVKQSSIVVDDFSAVKKRLVLRFAPRAGACEVAQAVFDKISDLKILEEYGNWVRVDDGKHAGWIVKDELK